MNLNGAVVTEVIGSSSLLASLLVKCPNGDIVRLFARTGGRGAFIQAVKVAEIHKESK